MAIEIEIEEDQVEGFNELARSKLKSSIEDYSSLLISEANRLEAGINSASGVPEITSSIVGEAENYLSNRFSNRNTTSKKMKFVKIGASISGILTGLVYDGNSMQEPTTLISFIVVLSLTIILTTVSVLKED